MTASISFSSCVDAASARSQQLAISARPESTNKQIIFDELLMSLWSMQRAYGPPPPHDTVRKGYCCEPATNFVLYQPKRQFQLIENSLVRRKDTDQPQFPLRQNIDGHKRNVILLLRRHRLPPPNLKQQFIQHCGRRAPLHIAHHLLKPVLPKCLSASIFRLTNTIRIKQKAVTRLDGHFPNRILHLCQHAQQQTVALNPLQLVSAPVQQRRMTSRRISRLPPLRIDPQIRRRHELRSQLREQHVVQPAQHLSRIVRAHHHRLYRHLDHRREQRRWHAASPYVRHPNPDAIFIHDNEIVKISCNGSHRTINRGNLKPLHVRIFSGQNRRLNLLRDH